MTLLPRTTQQAAHSLAECHRIGSIPIYEPVLHLLCAGMDKGSHHWRHHRCCSAPLCLLPDLAKCPELLRPCLCRWWPPQGRCPLPPQPLVRRHAVCHSQPGIAVGQHINRAHIIQMVTSQSSAGRRSVCLQENSACEQHTGNNWGGRLPLRLRCRMRTAGLRADSVQKTGGAQGEVHVSPPSPLRWRQPYLQSTSPTPPLRQ